MAQGTINVTADNIFPIIKKFLYSDHEIFLRELVSNAVDATTKLKALSRLGEVKGELGDTSIEILIDKEKKTLTVRDRGIGLTEEEVHKYINQVAFSGAEEFLKKYEDKGATGIIGHFGLGFYSAFMVASKVEIFSRSHAAQPEEAIHWSCSGSPEFELETITREERGTDIVLHIDADNEEFLEQNRIDTLLHKYCKFLPVPIVFGTRTETVKTGEGEEAKEEKIQVPFTVNNTTPAWTRNPNELTDEDYRKFYSELYPMSVEQPLFHIHLNVDYPFDLTGILYFPRIKPNMELQRNKIQLYQHQVFVTDSVEGIVPDFLTLLHGVIDSKDIPLNVSRSYLQSDGQVKKISGHITKKVADRLEEMFKDNRDDFASKWKDMEVIIEYGMLTEEKFYDRAKNFYLLRSISGETYTLAEYAEKIKAAQTDKDGQTVVLYTSDAEAQHTYIERALGRGYDVLQLGSPLVAHLLQRLEAEEFNFRFKRVDADALDNLIRKEDQLPSKLSEKDQENLKKLLEESLNNQSYRVKLESLDSQEPPFTVVRPEFMRRMKEMSLTGAGFYSDLPESLELVVNTNHDLVGKLLAEPDEAVRGKQIRQGLDLALLSQGLLKGEALSAFVNRSYEMM